MSSVNQFDGKLSSLTSITPNDTSSICLPIEELTIRQIIAAFGIANLAHGRFSTVKRLKLTSNAKIDGEQNKLKAQVDRT